MYNLLPFKLFRKRHSRLERYFNADLYVGQIMKKLLPPSLPPPQSSSTLGSINFTDEMHAASGASSDLSIELEGE
jgi:hypothetical protein